MRDPTGDWKPLFAAQRLVPGLLICFFFFVPQALADVEIPDGFTANVFHPGVGAGARHISVRENGDVFVRFRSPVQGFGSAVLRDVDGDHSADRVGRFDETGGTGIEVRGQYLYFSTTTAIYREKLGEFLPQGKREIVVSGLPAQKSHSARSFTFDNKGALYVNVGAPSNACQKVSRKPGSPGLSPCPELKQQGGIWKFKENILSQKNGTRYVTGLRNAVALDWGEEALYLVQHGRDQLGSLFPEYFSSEDNAYLPAEEFHRVQAGDNLGWPYTYYDGREGVRRLAPEYGGDGQKIDKRFVEPLIAFPAHWAPNDLLFYRGKQFPQYYRGGAFVAFHGSWNRAPWPQAGYRVVFISDPSKGDYTTFADGFSGAANIRSPGDARFRPMGLAEGPDGALYISDSVQGRIWKIRYTKDVAQ